MTGKAFQEKAAYFVFCVVAGSLFIFSTVLPGCRQQERAGLTSPNNQVTPAAPDIIDLDSLPQTKQPPVILLSSMKPPAIKKVSPQFYEKIRRSNRNESSEVAVSKTPTETPAQGKGFFTTYSTDDGLALDQVNCSFMDKQGNLWFGTNGGGVSKYDGKSFVNYTTQQGLANNIIWCIMEDHAGNLWFGTDGSGVSKYDGVRFNNYSTQQGLADNVVFSIIEDRKQKIWFGTLKSGVSIYDGKKFNTLSTRDGLAHNAVRTMMEDRDGNIWFGTLGGGASKYDGKVFSNFSEADGLAGSEVWSVAQDSAGVMWFGTGRGGLSKYDGLNFSNYFLSPTAQRNAITSIVPDDHGNLWLGTLMNGISKFHGNDFINYTTAQGLVNNTVRSILQDEKGNIWISTYGGGLSKYAGEIFSNFTRAQGLSNNIVFSIAQDTAGALWLGTSGGGVNKYDGRNFVDFTVEEGLASNTVNCVAKDHLGNTWIGTSGGGVSKYDGATFTNYTTSQGLANNNVFSIHEDREGMLWFGTSGGGVSRFDGKSFTNYTTVQGLVSNVVFCIAEDRQHNLWFGSLGGGVSKFDGHHFTNYTTAQGLPDNVVWTIFQDQDDEMWFGTQQGLASLSGRAAGNAETTEQTVENSAGTLFRTYTTREGLPDNFVTQVIQGDDKRLYIGTNLGICEMLQTGTGQNERQWIAGKIFNAQYGFPVRDVNGGQNAMFKDRSGIIWVGTGSDKTGLVRFDPNAYTHANQRPPTVIIKSVKINTETICWSDLDPQRIHQQRDSGGISALVTDEVNTYGRQLTWQERDSMQQRFKKISFSGVTEWNANPKKLRLPYFFNEVGFDFSAVETGKNFLVKYQYKLSGYDKDWSHPSTKTSVNFGNINDGSYTFMLKARSPEGVWSKPVEYTFTVLPPWWLSWWMYVIYFVFAACLILLLLRWNNRRIISQKKILQHKVSVATRQLSIENQKVNAQKQQIEATLSELKAAQSQLIQSEKMASLGELTAGIAHEIQNPLNFVNNFSEVNREMIAELKDEIEKGNYEEAKLIANDLAQNEEKINLHGKRAGGIVKGMLQHSQKSGGIEEPTDINKLADEYLRLAYHGMRAKDKSFNADLRTDFNESIGKINVVPQDIGRVLLNLYNNAFYAVAEKKKQQPEGYEPTVSVESKKISDKVEIKVTDNGNGIPQNIVDKIFQPFFTTKPTGQGTGLGLSLSYDIIKAHGGEIKVGHNRLPWRIPLSERTPLEEKVETKEGEGATFIIQLPA